jgi:hypothetical protein
MQIEVVNKKAERRRSGVYIGRPSVLGNPYKVGRDGTYAEVVEQYRVWLRKQWQAGGRVREELLKLAREYKQTRELTLCCWCKPYPCHGDVVAEAVIGIVRRQLV